MIKLLNILIFLNYVLNLSCSSSPPPSKLESCKSETISSIKIFKLINFTVVRVDPNGRKVNVDRKGYNVKSGNAFKVPFEIIVLESKNEKYIISTKNLGNGELSVNETIYKFDSSSQQLFIKFDEGILIEKGGSVL